MRGQAGGTGPVPLICHRCRTLNPDQSWCKFHGEPHSIDRFPRRANRPSIELICHEAAYQLYEAPEEKICPWCGEVKTVVQMKGTAPGTRGKAPTVCADCRASHPDDGWCTYHGQSHPALEFDNKHGKLRNVCRLARHEARYPDRALIECQACGVARVPGMFSGGRIKQVVCKLCNAEHSEQKWCRECRDWRDLALFPAGRDDSGARCNPCLIASKHNTTVAEILRIQGADSPMCGSCGSIEKLCVDHDHGCCPGARARSCGKCVLGYLCWRCNSSEGLLMTSERAFALAEHMLQRENKVAQLRAGGWPG